MTLENVRLKVEAFDYLQLPINITEGCIGRLVVQVCTHLQLSHPGHLMSLLPLHPLWTRKVDATHLILSFFEMHTELAGSC